LEINDQEIIINQAIKRQSILWKSIVVISIYNLNIANPGSYGTTRIKQKWVVIITNEGKKHHISTTGTGKNVNQILLWIKENCANYPHLRNINFLE